MEIERLFSVLGVFEPVDAVPIIVRSGPGELPPLSCFGRGTDYPPLLVEASGSTVWSVLQDGD